MTKHKIKHELELLDQESWKKEEIRKCLELLERKDIRDISKSCIREYLESLRK